MWPIVTYILLASLYASRVAFEWSAALTRYSKVPVVYLLLGVVACRQHARVVVWCGVCCCGVVVLCFVVGIGRENAVEKPHQKKEKVADLVRLQYFFSPV